MGRLFCKLVRAAFGDYNALPLTETELSSPLGSKILSCALASDADCTSSVHEIC